MKVTLGDIQGAKETLSKLANIDLPIKTSYILSKLIKVLNDEYATIEDFRVQLIKKHGAAEGDNVRVTPGTDGFDNFMKQYMEFLNTEITIEMSKIDIDVNQTDLNIKPIDIISIDKFVNFIGLPVENETIVSQPDVEESDTE